jgi:hypothetical protein
MHVPTHILSGWCAGNLLRLTPKQRLGCMIAATAADLDGMGILVSQDLYWDYHHKLGHNLFFALLLAGVLTIFLSDRRRLFAFLVFLAMAHLHLLLDYFGSGPDWPIWYLWPSDLLKIQNPHAWAFFSWQNIAFGYGLLAWTILIAWRQRRTPLEWLMPRLDLQLVALLHRRDAKTQFEITNQAKN